MKARATTSSQLAKATKMSPTANPTHQAERRPITPSNTNPTIKKQSSNSSLPVNTAA